MNQNLSVLLSSMSVVWYTPRKYIEAAEQVFGGRIDLDPASDPVANFNINARRFFTEEQDGLTQDWQAANVFCNPPYGKRPKHPGQRSSSSQGTWAVKMIEEYKKRSFSKGILLVNFVPGYKWFSPLWEYPMCAVDHCISFSRPDAGPTGKAKASSCFVYFGSNVQGFYEAFRPFGPIITRAY